MQLRLLGLACVLVFVCIVGYRIVGIRTFDRKVSSAPISKSRENSAPPQIRVYPSTPPATFRQSRRRFSTFAEPRLPLMGSPVPPPTATPSLSADERKDAKSTESLISQVRYSADPDERASGLSALGFHTAAPEIVQVCIEALADPSEDVRLEAALALDTLQDPAAIPSLIEALKTESAKKVSNTIMKTLAELAHLVKMADP